MIYNFTNQYPIPFIQSSHTHIINWDQCTIIYGQRGNTLASYPGPFLDDDLEGGTLSSLNRGLLGSSCISASENTAYDFLQ